MQSKSMLLVAGQVLAIGYLAVTGPLLVSPRFIGLELAGLALVAWAVMTMGFA